MQIKLLEECPSAQPLTYDFLESQNLSENFPKRFWEKVNKTDACWIWTASIQCKGYGTIGRGGRARRMIGAHKASWILHYGPIPKRLCVLHHCDCRRCVRPDHLWLGTQIDNLMDMRQKGRYAHGNMIPNALLTPETAEQIRADYIPGVVTMQSLANRHGIGLTTVFKVIHKQTWKSQFPQL